MSDTLSVLRERLEKILGSKVSRLHEALGELTLVVRSEDYLEVAKTLRDEPSVSTFVFTKYKPVSPPPVVDFV